MAKRWKWGFVVLAAVWAALFGTMLGYAWNVTHQAEPMLKVPMEQVQNTNISEVAQETMDRFWTVAVFGVDSREGKLGKGTRSDMEMVLNINLKTGEIRMVSVYRDTYVKIDEKNKYDKINQAYFEGGPAQAIWALSENMDLNIDDYVSFSWKAVADAINLLGGIDVEISPEEFKQVTGTDAYPDFLKKDVENDTLKVYCNGDIVYKIKGVTAKVSVIWNYTFPKGGGDTHFSVMKGSKADLVIRQGQEQGYKPELYIEALPDIDLVAYEKELAAVMSTVADKYPGVALDKVSDNVWQVQIPATYRVGHEAHFGQVMENYLQYLQDGKLPDWEVPNMIAKYYVTTHALEMAKVKAKK